MEIAAIEVITGAAATVASATKNSQRRPTAAAAVRISMAARHRAALLLARLPVDRDQGLARDPARAVPQGFSADPGPGVGAAVPLP